ncbi:hypothetical protein Sjap_020036 [Stephania japonica]|uniref:Beta-amylase n=1 Tax=Stephania japonica TaxID=461633 RepID=A0AAP0F5G4_9MAGN
MEIGKDNQDIFFTDREGRRNTECLSWGIDKERVLKGRTGTEVYFDLMRSFRMHFDDLFAEGLISAVEIGLGLSVELKYPSFAERMGWRYPCIGEFQRPKPIPVRDGGGRFDGSALFGKLNLHARQQLGHAPGFTFGMNQAGLSGLTMASLCPNPSYRPNKLQFEIFMNEISPYITHCHLGF